MDNGIATALQPIRARFLRLLQDHQIAIQSDLEFAIASPEQANQALTRIAAVLHKIAGTAGTLGFGKLGDHAREVEYQITEADLEQTQLLNDIYFVIIDFLEVALDASQEAA